MTAAAEKLGLNKSTVSRQLRKFGLTRVDGKVDLPAYEAARARDLNPLMARATQDEEPEPEFRQPAPPAAPRGLQGAATAHKALQAKLLQMELDERQGKLVSRAAVNRRLFIASRMLRDVLLALPSRLAGELAAMSDAGEVRVRIDQEMRTALGNFAAQVGGLTDADDDPSVQGSSA